MEPGNRRPGVPRRRAQTAHDVVRTGVGQEAAEATDLFAQRPQRVSNAATQSELQKSRWRRRTGETNYNRDIETACVKFLQPGSPKWVSLARRLGVKVRVMSQYEILRGLTARSARPNPYYGLSRHRGLGLLCANTGRPPTA